MMLLYFLLSILLVFIPTVMGDPVKDQLRQINEQCYDTYVAPYSVKPFEEYATLIVYWTSTVLCVISMGLLLVICIKLMSIRVAKWRQAWSKRRSQRRHANVEATGDELVNPVEMDVSIPVHLHKVSQQTDTGLDVVHHTIQCLIVINMLFVMSLFVFFLIYHITDEEHWIPSLIFDTFFVLSCYWTVVIILSLYFNIRQFATQTGIASRKKRVTAGNSRTDQMLISIMAQPTKLLIALHLIGILVAIVNGVIVAIFQFLPKFANSNLLVIAIILIVKFAMSSAFYIVIIVVITFTGFQLFILLRKILSRAYGSGETSARTRRSKRRKTAFQLFLYFFSNIFLVMLVANRLAFTFSLVWSMIECGTLFAFMSVQYSILSVPFIIIVGTGYIMLPLKPIYDVIVFMFINRWFAQQLKEVLRLFCLDTGQWQLVTDDNDDDHHGSFGIGDLQEKLLDDTEEGGDQESQHL